MAHPAHPDPVAALVSGIPEIYTRPEHGPWGGGAVGRWGGVPEVVLPCCCRRIMDARSHVASRRP